jgi:MYXO-CTERM domain-containing protein
MAVGRNQSGTEVTLFGSVPPVADGSGPMSLVPWAAAGLALAGLALWTRRRHQRHDDAPVVTEHLA